MHNPVLQQLDYLGRQVITNESGYVCSAAKSWIVGLMRCLDSYQSRLRAPRKLQSRQIGAQTNQKLMLLVLLTITMFRGARNSAFPTLQ
jgi:hypothetical protein